MADKKKPATSGISKADIINDESKQSALLDKLENMEEGEAVELTSSYHKFSQPGEKVVGLFGGYDEVVMNKGEADEKVVPCIVLKTKEGRKMFGQTVIIGAIKEAKPEVEHGDGVIISYKGKQGTGVNKYDAFSVSVVRND